MKRTSKYDDRTQTNMLCSQRLKETAKARGIVLSTTLEQALEIKLALPTERDDVERQLERLIAERDALEGQLEVIESKKQAKVEAVKQTKRVADREIVRRFWTPNGSEKFAKALKMFAQKYDIHYDEAYKEVLK